MANIHATIKPADYAAFREQSEQVFGEGTDWEFCVIPATLFVRRDGIPKVVLYPTNMSEADTGEVMFKTGGMPHVYRAALP